MYRHNKGRVGAARLFLFFCFPMIMLSCGLAQYPTLLRPRQTESPGDILDEFIFIHDPANDIDIFQGYELFYKFYTAQGLENDVYREDTAYIENNAVFGSNVPNILSSRSYFRVTSPSIPSDTKPLISFSSSEKQEETEVIVGFEPNPVYNTDEAYAAWGGNSIITIRRSISDTGDDEKKPFLPEMYDPEDTDIPDAYDPLDPSLSIALYTVTYGYDFSQFRYFYSEPLLLGNISLF
jgi:hypothetical protein